MATVPDRTPLTPEQYLAIERRAEERHEYYRGAMFAMSGASRHHARIESNLIRHLGNQLEGGPCEVYTSNMRVLVRPTGLFTYPDVSVSCGESQFLDGHVDTLVNPVVVVEVLSPSTESYDRVQKFAHYRAIPSLREYVLIAQDRMAAECFRRTEEGWIWTLAEGPEGRLVLASIGCEIPLAALYARVEFPEGPPPPEAHPGPPA